MLPANSPSHSQRRMPGILAAVEPSGSLTDAPFASRSSMLAMNASASVSIFANSSRAAATPRSLSADHPRSRAAT